MKLNVQVIPHQNNYYKNIYKDGQVYHHPNIHSTIQITKLVKLPAH